VEQARELVKIMQAKENLSTLCGLSREETEINFSKQRLGAGDAVIIANDISDMGALMSLDVSNNDIGHLTLPEGWSEKKGMFGVGYKHTDGRKQEGHPGKPEGIIAIANVIPDMRPLTKFVFSGDDNSKSVTMETIMVVADFSEKGLGVSGGIMLSAFLPKCT
jgi:hypothetical protein